MPPESVPVLLLIRLLPIWRLWAQPCTKIPPPPCELSVMPKPSMLDGLHQKLLGNGLFSVLSRQSATEKSVVPAGKSASPPLPNGSADPGGTLTPFESTVMPAPS